MKKRKKLMVFMYSLHEGGAQRTVVNIMNNINKDKFKVILVLGTNRNNVYINQVNKGIEIKNLNCTKLRYSMVSLIKIIRKVKPDLLFTTLNNNNITLAIARLFSFKNIPVIIRETSNRTQAGQISILNKLFTYISYNYLVKKVVALSQGVKEDLINNFKINKKKIAVIYNPVEVEKIRELSLAPLEDISFKDNEKILVAVGRLVNQKDYPNLIKAYSIVSDIIKSKLLIIGNGQLEKELKNLCLELNIDSNVKFLGYKTNPYKYMRIADLFVLSSRAEGFGHVIVESMSVKTAVLSTDCLSGPREIIKNNEYGVLVPTENSIELAEKIIWLLKNDDLRKSYAKKGFERAQDFKAKKVTREYELLFGDI